MKKILIIRHKETSFLQTHEFRSALRSKGFEVWNEDRLGRWSEPWWAAYQKALQTRSVIIILMTPTTKDLPDIHRELALAHKHQMTPIPVLFDGDIERSMPDSLTDRAWTDMSTDETYATGIEQLIERILEKMGISPTSRRWRIQEVLREMGKQLPDICWIRIIHFDGFTYPEYNYDAGKIIRNTDIAREEDRYGAMSAAMLSLSERISQELNLGDLDFTVIAGKSASHYFLPIGDNNTWYFSFAINGQPPVDEILAFFKHGNYLAQIEAILK